jgi:acetyl-CoA carboxylase carboxyltransferase component
VEKRLVDGGDFLNEDRVVRGGALKGWVDRGRRWMDDVMQPRRTRDWEGRGLASRGVKRRVERLSRRAGIFFCIN